jgi:presenilin-like A22 family membrane protease
MCAFLLLISDVQFDAITFFPEDFFGSLSNALYFVILVAMGASLLYWLLKRRNRKVISVLTGFAFTLAVFMLSAFYLSAAFSVLTVPYAEALILILSLSLLITIAAYFAIFRTRRVSNLVVLLLGGALGTFLGALIPTSSAVLILCFLAIYDIIAVYRGPVGKIAQSGLEKLRGLSFSFGDMQMGLGDLTFYSMLSGHMLLNFGFISCLASVMGILAGCLLVFKMLEKKGMFPGLPFPIFLGLATGFLASYANL